jgi:mutual gliding-motility protein MglA
MVLFNYSTKELTAKVVYYGAGLCGKTTNLVWIHEKVPIKNKGKMLSLATETDRTLFFDFLPIELGTIRGMKTRIQLYTVPGQVFYNATRRMVLKGADCVVFVCDSQEAMLDANLESFENLRQNLEANEIDVDEVPMVFQYNKRDLPNALPIEILNERLNPRGLPFYEAVALKGQGVEETLKGVTGLVFRSLASRYGGAEAAASRPEAASPAPPPAPPAAAAAPAMAAPAPPPPRAEAPAPPPEPIAHRPPVVAPLPSLNMRAPAETPEDLLESLELQPSSDDLDGELSLAPAPPVEEEEEDIETFTVDEYQVEAPRPAVDPKATLVSEGNEAEEYRRKLRRPPAPPPPAEVSLEELDEEDVEELSLHAPPPPDGPLREKPAESTKRPGTRDTLPPMPPGSRSGIRPLAATAPVNVQLGPGQSEISIPVDVTLAGASQPIHIHVRLSLHLK